MKGGHAFGVIRAPAQFAHESRLRRTSCCSSVWPGAACMAWRVRTSALVGMVASCCGQLVHRGARTRHLPRPFPDQAPFGGLFGGQFVGQQGQAHGARHADALRQEPGAAGVRNQADLAEGLQEGGRLGWQSPDRRPAPPLAPAPAAMPLTARWSARAGFAGAASAACSALDHVADVGHLAGPPAMAGSARSWPAQKPRPAPVSTSTRMVLSALDAVERVRSSACISPVKLLSLSGRFSVRRAMPSCDGQT
jgi:hypothetical protein